MPSFIQIRKRWADEDVVQATVTVADGVSTHVNSAYLSLDWFGETAKGLHVFSRQIYGGLFNMEAGMEGPEYADGYFAARLHWFAPSRLLINTKQQSDFFSFKGREVAAEATFYLSTEPALLDRFIGELDRVHEGKSDEVNLECVPLHVT